MSNQQDNQRKLVVVGDGATGKTCLLAVHANGEFPSVYVPTVFENYSSDVTVDGVNYEVQLWDTAGQEEYDRLRPLSYPNTHIVLLCFSFDSPDSLDNIREKWIKEVQHYCPKSAYMLVGLKKDLATDDYVIKDLARRQQRPVQTQEAQTVASDLGISKFMECSAINSEGVEEIFEEAVRMTNVMKKSGKKKKDAVCKIL